MPHEFELSRRKALAALGTIGAASAGAGLGTSAFFSDQETFENNRLVAGSLDLKAGWEVHYSDWSPDELEGIPEGNVTMTNNGLIEFATERDHRQWKENTRIAQVLQGDPPTREYSSTDKDLGDPIDFDHKCPPDSPQPPKDYDFNGNGVNDSWIVHEQEDEQGNIIRVVCVPSPPLSIPMYVLIYNPAGGPRRVIGACVYPGGRNEFTKCAEDTNGDGQTDGDNDGQEDELGWFRWTSWDGPLPGEELDIDGDGEDEKVTHENYHMFDEDGDGQIDVTEYTFHADEGEVEKRHYELDWAADERLEEIRSDRITFAPKEDPEEIPTDFDGMVPEDAPSMTDLDPSTLPAGIETVTSEIVSVRGETHELPIRVTNGRAPLDITEKHAGLRMPVHVTHTEGVVEVEFTEGYLTTLGAEAGSPVTVLSDGSPTNFERDTEEGGPDTFRVFLSGGVTQVEILYDELERPPAISEPCEILPDAPERPVIELTDVMPGDELELTLWLVTCDSDGFLWMNGNIIDNLETGMTEPERDDPDENGGDPGELAQAIESIIWYDTNGDNILQKPEEVIFEGSLVETMAALSQGNGIPLDGNLATSFTEIVADTADSVRPGGGADEDRECFEGSSLFNIAWRLRFPVDHANEIQTDTLRFGFGFYTEQCRHNDGSGLNNEAVNPDEVDD